MSLEMLHALGGVGLFLLGMLILTGGLKELAGDALRRWLARFTTTPARGAVAGAFTTAAIQSSSATIVTAVGFVGAGLLTFQHTLGIVFGANIGTTMTGWFVTLLGFKLSLGTFVMPLLLVGALMKMFAPGRWEQLGWTLAGFSLIFIGIETMQDGLAPFKGLVSPDNFPDDTLFGRFQLVLLGIAITVVTQSSSAGVATALVALGAGAISYPQAAAMIIGMDVGTTFTAVLASLGGSAAMRQTAYAHVAFNTINGCLAFFLLIPLKAVLGGWAAADPGNAQIGLVAFHTFYNSLGVCYFLPFTQAFAKLIQRLAPEKGSPLVRRLDDSLLVDADAASDAAVATIRDITVEQASLLSDQLSGEISARRKRDMRANIVRAIDQTRGFVDAIDTTPDHPAHARHRAALHGIDHLRRLQQRARQSSRIATLVADHRLNRLGRVLRFELAQLAAPDLGTEALQKIAARFDRLERIIWHQRHGFREATIASAASRRDPADTIAILDSLRWLHRVAYHIARILIHLETARHSERMGEGGEAGDVTSRERSRQIEEDDFTDA